tara:strand:- start:2186 stop:3337 length:1152 start_codon:yes stop_codon:yes gene_type:complete
MSFTQNNLYLQRDNFFKTKSFFDWIFALFLTAGVTYGFFEFSVFMNFYEKAILVLLIPSLTLVSWYWSPIRNLALSVAFLSILAITIYDSNLAMAETNFWLKYFFSSQSAILWMSTLFFLSTFFYWIGFISNSIIGSYVGNRFCWFGILFGSIGLMVRWFESYLLGSDIGHIPVSNLYEVFILFCLITALFMLFYESKYNVKNLSAFVMLIITASVCFLIWYTITRDAHEIQPLVPALQSWWMKIHVPANFIGYGTFALAAMVGIAYLFKSYNFFGNRLPSLIILDDIMYKAISVGFTFFTIATILGALWAAEAWGGYWSWDPKETWALIVWLNYAGWLHMRLIKGLRGRISAWWAIIGLLVTTFAFLGVNMFLSGLHSYGEL